MSSGWTGPGAEDKNWWTHAASTSSYTDPHTGKPWSLDPDTNKKFSWSALANFQPIDMRSPTASEDMFEATVHEIVRRIMGRFHRGEHIQHVVNIYHHWRRATILESFNSSIFEQEKLKEEALTFFRSIDKDKSGYIDSEELLEAFPQLDQTEAKRLVEEADTDKDQRISFDEFWAVIEIVVIQMRAADTADLKRAMVESFYSSVYEPEKIKEEAKVYFDMLDKDCSGHMDTHELLAAFPQLDESAAKLMVEETDTNHDQQISFDEFWAALETVIFRMRATDKATEQALEDKAQKEMAKKEEDRRVAVAEMEEQAKKRAKNEAEDEVAAKHKLRADLARARKIGELVKKRDWQGLSLIQEEALQTAIALRVVLPRCTAAIYGNIGNCCRALSQYEKSIQMHERDRAICEEIGDRAGLGAVLGNLANCYKSMGKWDKAIELLLQAKAIFEEVGEHKREEKVRKILKECYQRCEEFDEIRQVAT